jgi:hypothetical protein
MVQPVRQATGVLTPTCGTGAASSLSTSPIKREMPAEPSSFATSFSNAEVRSTHHSLLASGRLAPPLGDSFHAANPRFFEVILPRFHDHQSTPPPAIAYQVSDLYHHRWELIILLLVTTKLPSRDSNARGLLVQLRNWVQEFLSKLGAVCPLQRRTPPLLRSGHLSDRLPWGLGARAYSLSRGSGHVVNLVVVRSLVKNWRAHHAVCAGYVLRGDRAPCTLWAHLGHAPASMGCQRPLIWTV